MGRVGGDRKGGNFHSKGSSDRSGSAGFHSKGGSDRKGGGFHSKGNSDRKGIDDRWWDRGGKGTSQYTRAGGTGNGSMGGGGGGYSSKGRSDPRDQRRGDRYDGNR